MRFCGVTLGFLQIILIYQISHFVQTLAICRKKYLVVGKRGEIFTSKQLRNRTKIKKGGKVRASIVDGRLVLESIPSIEELLRRPVLVSESAKAESLSEEARREAGAYG